MLSRLFRRRTTCPIEPEKFEWLERAFHWILGQFGEELVLRRPVMVPDASFFQHGWEPTGPHLERLFGSICERMGLDPDGVGLYVGESSIETQSNHTIASAGGSAAGLFHRDEQGRPVVGVSLDLIDEPITLTATLAHELAHVRLLHERRLTGEEEDHELTTEATAGLLGFGVFSANSAVRERDVQFSTGTGWSVGQLGYFRVQTWGALLGLLAHHRGEDRPPWASALTGSARRTMSATQRWLARR